MATPSPAFPFILPDWTPTLDLLAQQTTLVTETATELMALGEQSCATWVELQGRWWHDLEALMAAALSPWQAAGNAGSAGAWISPPEQASTTSLVEAAMEAASQAWPVAAQVMVNALQHDLQADPVRH